MTYDRKFYNAVAAACKHYGLTFIDGKFEIEVNQHTIDSEVFNAFVMGWWTARNTFKYKVSSDCSKLLKAVYISSSTCEVDGELQKWNENKWFDTSEKAIDWKKDELRANYEERKARLRRLAFQFNSERTDSIWHFNGVPVEGITFKHPDGTTMVIIVGTKQLLPKTGLWFSSIDDCIQNEIKLLEDDFSNKMKGLQCFLSEEK